MLYLQRSFIQFDLISCDILAEPTMQELVSDLKVIDQTGSCVGHFIKNLRANVSQFDPSEYAEKLVMLFSALTFL